MFVLPLSDVANVKTEELDKLYKSVELELKSNDSAVLKSFAKFSTTAAAHLDIDAQRLLLKITKYLLIFLISLGIQ